VKEEAVWIRIPTFNLESEVWKWILVVPWWRISFEYKRHMIDIREKEKKERH
jgi:hypothetical protein